MSEWQHAEGDGDAFDDLREWAAADDGRQVQITIASAIQPGLRFVSVEVWEAHQGADAKPFASATDVSIEDAWAEITQQMGGPACDAE